MKIMVTGGAGFIGSALVRQWIAESDCTVINVDKLTYAGNLHSLADLQHHPRHIFEQVDICDVERVEKLFRLHRPDAVIHLAAESHVDRSIHGPMVFIETNITGTAVLLQAARGYWNELSGEAKENFRFHHVSTDEVYGDLDWQDSPFTEETPYTPSSPYSASKAASDHLVRAWHRTYGLPVLITNCSNNYGPCQFPEKLIPLVILNALNHKPLPVYGQGLNVRDWLYVEDHARALRLVLAKGEPGRTYNIGGGCEKQNIQVVKSICSILDRMKPLHSQSYHALITFVNDRPGHDRRYAIDASRIQQELGWQPLETFDSGLEKTVNWYLNNGDWVTNVQSGAYRGWLESHYRLPAGTMGN